MVFHGCAGGIGSGLGCLIKTITGDHHNIGKELARQIELGSNILTPDALKGPDGEETILRCDGFAKVQPFDKHHVVEVLRKITLAKKLLDRSN